MKGFNLDHLIIDGGTGGGNSKRVNNYIKGKSSKRSNSESGKIKNKSKYKPSGISNLVKSNKSSKKGSTGPTKKKYSPHPNELRRKTNSVEPPSHDIRMVSSPGGQIKYHRHNKSVNNPKHNQYVGGKHKTKHYVMSQGNSELKQTLENAKKKGNGLRSLHKSDINSLEHDDSSEYEIVRDMDQQMISKEMNVHPELYNSYKRQKLVSSALDTPISHFSKDTSPQFVVQKKNKIRTSSLVGNNVRPTSSKDKKRASSSNAAQHRHYMVNNSNNSTNSNEQSTQIENYSAQKYYEMYQKNHHKSAHSSVPKNYNQNYSNHNWEVASGYPKNLALKVIEEASNSKKAIGGYKNSLPMKQSNDSSQTNFKNRKSNEKIKVIGKK